MKVIIVDDEIDACEGLAALLANDPSIELAAICRNGKEALTAIQEHSPDLLFLDIQMPGMNGFAVIQALEVADLPFIIFTTAFDEFALEAFKVHALDYLLKPFTDERFYDALAHAKKALLQKQSGHYATKLKSLLEDWRPDPVSPTLAPTRLLIRSSGKTHFLAFEQVIWVEGFDYYLKVHEATHFHLVRESLKHLLTRLPAHFIRIHKSTIINTHHLLELEPASRGNCRLLLSNGKRLLMSKKYRALNAAFFE